MSHSYLGLGLCVLFKIVRLVKDVLCECVCVCVRLCVCVLVCASSWPRVFVWVFRPQLHEYGCSMFSCGSTLFAVSFLSHTPVTSSDVK